MRRKALIGVLSAAVAGAIMLLILTSSPAIERSQTEQPEVKYFFSGDSGKVTQTFHIPTRNWKITYSVQATDNSFFKFSVYREGSGAPVAEIPDLYTTESSYVIVDGGPGDFYLVVTSSLASWKITVTSINE
ncbi:hypothetical protein KEJ39_00050 [Candidatus Bathyarchaeota archaeon]|nr:hypothetical protein [Candidatus Bathyarchaeota archaeon]